MNAGTVTGTEEKVGKMICGSNGLGHGKKARGIAYPLPKRLYTLEEAATYLGRTVWAMRGLVWNGKIPIVRDGKRIFVDIEDLTIYVAKNKTTYS